MMWSTEGPCRLFTCRSVAFADRSTSARGTIRRNAQIRVVREGTVVYETGIASLRRFKDDAREVLEGFECGILLEGFNDVKEGDILEAFETKVIERTDLEVAGDGQPAEEAPPEEPA